MGADLGPNCLEKLSAEDKETASKERVMVWTYYDGIIPYLVNYPKTDHLHKCDLVKIPFFTIIIPVLDVL